MAKRAYFNADKHSTTHPHRSLTEQTYDRLRSDIIDGVLAPGIKLRVEHLRERYGVGAGTLREAIIKLSSDALIFSEGQRGFWVTPMSMKDLEDLTQVRLHLEIEALRESIRINHPTWRIKVQHAFTALSKYENPCVLPEHRQKWDLLNSHFHEALISGVSSPWTQRILQMLARQSERYRRLSLKLTKHERNVHTEHQMIYDSAMSGELARAALALEMHIRATPDLIGRAWRAGAIDHQGVLTETPTTNDITWDKTLALDPAS